ncbi:MAG: putative toxin-antitoxin system toxin component, PIN family [Schwartzia sp.]|nr:putative toxin-antitoxin system toxin component, PIN family [Schwartzia sp. (in: firmicutes)]
MKILLDTNILISAFVFGGAVGKLLNLLMALDYEMYVSDYVNSEFREKLERRWPDKANVVYGKYRTMPFVFCDSTKRVLCDLRDPKDNPVLSDAIYHQVDILLSGDKDLLESGTKYPMVFSPSMLFYYIQHNCG